MLQFTRSGSIADVIAQVRGIPERVISYAASTALTRVAQAGQKAVVAELPRRLDRPTAYTLGATRVEPSTVSSLAARVAVKDKGAAGTAPEHYLVPEVFGGPRREKRFERALRYAGILQRGEFAVPGRRAALDAAGNLVRLELADVLAAAGARAPGRRAGKARQAAQRSVFAGAIHGRRGVWRRVERKVEPVLIFARSVPSYRTRVDFADIVRRIAEAEFAPEFQRAADAIVRRRGGA